MGRFFNKRIILIYSIFQRIVNSTPQRKQEDQEEERESSKVHAISQYLTSQTS